MPEWLLDMAKVAVDGNPQDAVQPTPPWDRFTVWSDDVTLCLLASGISAYQYATY